MKLYVEEDLPVDKTPPSKRPTPSTSAGFSDDPGITDEEVERAIEGTRDSRPVRLPVAQLPIRGRVDNEARVNSAPEEEQPITKADAVETYDAVELEARREEEPLHVPDPGDDNPSEPDEPRERCAERGVEEPERQTRRRRPPVRFGIGKFERR